MPETESAVRQYLGFFVGGEECALPVLEVCDVVESAQIARLPSMPPWIRGVTRVGSQVVPVVDLAARLGLPSSAQTRRACVVVVEARLDSEEGPVGLLVDSVGQVMDLVPGEGGALPGRLVGEGFVSGSGRSGTRVVPVLGLDRLLCAEGLSKAAGRAAPGPAAEAEDASAEAAS